MLNVMNWFHAGLLLMLGLMTSATYAAGYTYEKRKIQEQIVHVLTVDPKEYQIELVRANNGSGRETVPAIAKRTGAEMAINGGFFAITLDPSQDGMPSGTLIIKGHVYHQKNGVQPLILIRQNKLSVIKSNPIQQTSKNTSMVSGIPLLIERGNIPANLFNKKNDFYAMPHARTALGVKADGSIVIVVAEHHYQMDLAKITMGDIQMLLSSQGKNLAKQYHHNDPWDMTLGELKQTLKKKASFERAGQGLTIVDLARVMKLLGCQSAINLDGGGSSTLYINGKVVNQTIGDADEGNALQVVRPVSDAIIFKKHG